MSTITMLIALLSLAMVTSTFSNPETSESKMFNPSLDAIIAIQTNITVALSSLSKLPKHTLNSLELAAFSDCSELLSLSVEHLETALDLSTSYQDKMLLLSAVQTYIETSRDGFVMHGVSDAVRSLITNTCRFDELWQLAAIPLNFLRNVQNKIYASKSLPPPPIQSPPPRRLMQTGPSYPKWVRKDDRVALKTPAKKIKVDLTVSKTMKKGKDGSPVVNNITDALIRVPRKLNTSRYVVFVDRGVYIEQDLVVNSNIWNLMLIGKGKEITKISCGKNTLDYNITTYKTACFGVSGLNFIARDIGFVNFAGPSKRQAVALRINGDKALLYGCSIEGNQDTLYAHALRMFIYNCYIYGTVDIIFGNAAVVLQRCKIFARVPLNGQSITFTAQKRMDPNQPTGFSFIQCQVTGDEYFNRVRSRFPAYLGRPWGLYANVAYMESALGVVVDKAGWLKWDETLPASKTSFFGEFSNRGKGSNTNARVSWSYPHMTREQAEDFTVTMLIDGLSWIPSWVLFQPGL